MRTNSFDPDDSGHDVINQPEWEGNCISECPYNLNDKCTEYPEWDVCRRDYQNEDRG